MTTQGMALPAPQRPSLLRRLNTDWHQRGLFLLGAIVLLHWLEHIVQAFQIWVLNYQRPKALGLLGTAWPWLVTSEWLHYGFALVMLVGLALLWRGFTGRARVFWMIALGIQIFHFFEHQILLLQAQTHNYWFGGKVPTSLLQAAWPMGRVEIHLVYNTLVTIPMIVALYFHRYPPLRERGHPTSCGCARTPAAPV